MGEVAAAAAALKKKPHVFFVPFPGQGHINPVLPLAKCLATKGLRVTVIITTNARKSATMSVSDSDMISISDVSDGSEEVKGSESIDAFLERLQAVFSRNLAEFLDKHDGSAKAIVYDSTLPWVLDIAHERGLIGVSFFTQNCGVIAVYYHLKQGSINYPYEDSVVSLPLLPMLGTKDLPYFNVYVDPNNSLARFHTDQFSNIEKVDGILINTFYKLESEILDWMASRCPIKTVGPTYALLQTDKKLPNNHMINLVEPNHKPCEEWLNSREPSSVIYVSFGSMITVGKEQMEEVAWGLLTSNCYFLWVVRASERDKLPENFDSTASEKGLIVHWCHQPQVLAHDALACFMTHCGWNSTLEALTHGVPLIAMGQWMDQTTNAKLIEDVWRIGIRVKAGDTGIVTREEISMCIEQITRGDKGKELKRNAHKWKELANEATEEGGTSTNNIEDFVSELMCS